MENAIQIYKPDIPLKGPSFFTKELKLTDDFGPYISRTCAVVGNGGILLGSGCGYQIDAHDFIIRSNLADIKHFAKDVGKKTSVTTINGLKLRDLDINLSNNGTDQKSRDDLERLRFLNDTVLWYLKEKKQQSIQDRLRRVYDSLQKLHLPVKLAYSPWNQPGVAGWYVILYYLAKITISIM